MSKALDDLNVSELRHELRGRQLSSKGKKEELRERLESWLVENGFDVDDYEFVDPYLKKLRDDMDVDRKLLRDEIGVDRKLLRDEIGVDIKSLRDDMDVDRKLLRDEIGVDIKSLRDDMGVDIKSLRDEIGDNIKRLKEKNDTDMNNLKENLDFKVQDLKAEIDSLRQKQEKEIEQIKDKLQENSMGLKIETHGRSRKIKPPVFDGLVPWAVFRHQFETAARHNGWTEEEKATELIMVLQGKAADLLQTMLGCQEYQKLVDTMERRFGNNHMQEVYRNELKSRIQKQGETLQELEADVRKLAYLAHPE